MQFWVPMSGDIGLAASAGERDTHVAFGSLQKGDAYPRARIRVGQVLDQGIGGILSPVLGSDANIANRISTAVGSETT